MEYCYGPIEVFRYFLSNFAQFAGWDALTSHNSCKYFYALKASSPAMSLVMYSYYLLLTITLELIVFLPPMRKLSWKKKLPIILVANLLSHPFFVWILPSLFDDISIGTYLLSGELIVLGIECLVFYLFLKTPKIWWVIAANLFSWQVGAMLPPI